MSSPDNAEGEKEFSVIKPSTTDKSYSDTNVKELSTYAYRVTVLSNAETSPVSDVAEVRTPSLSRTEERRVGKESCQQCRTRWSAEH